MGNQQSGLGAPSKDVDFKSYVTSSWRSQRSNELDALGGLGRPALALGQSFNAKMQYLGEQLLEQGDKMQDMLAPTAPNTFSKEVAMRKQTSVTGPRNTYIRAAERRGEKLIVVEAAVDGAGFTQQPASRFLSQAEYQKMRTAAMAAEKQKQAKQRPPAQPAEWRKRVHASRRNAMLMVKTMLYLKRGHKHPKRMMRFNDLGFYIPQLLAEDCGRFVSEQERYCSIRRSIASARAELDELLRSSTTAAATSTTTAQLPLKQGAATAAAAVAALAAGAKPLPLPTTHSSGPVGSTALSRAVGSSSSGYMGMGGANPAVADAAALVTSMSEGQHERTNAQSGYCGEAIEVEDDRRTPPGGESRRVTFDGDRKAPPEASLSLASRHMSPMSSGVQRLRGAEGEPRSRSVDRERLLTNNGDQLGSSGEHESVRLVKQLSTGGAAGNGAGLAAWRPLQAGLSDVAEEQRAFGEDGGRSSAPVRLPAVFTGSPKRTAGGAAEKLSGGGSANSASSPARRPWGVPTPGHRSAGVQQRATSGRLGLDNHPTASTTDGSTHLTSNAPAPASAQPTRVNRQISMPATSRLQPGTPEPSSTAGGVLLPDIRSGRASSGGMGRASVPPVTSSPVHAEQQDQGQDAGMLLANEQLNKPSSKYGRMAQIRVELDKQYDLLKRSSKLMGMYINRWNGAWAEAQQWSAPAVTPATELTHWAKGDQFNVYKADVMRQLRLGQIAVQLLVGDDDFTLPPRARGGSGGGRGPEGAGAGCGAQQDLWTADLWELIEAARPGIMPATARIGGLTLCGRALCQLVLSAQSLAGSDALERLHVVLHVSGEQEEELVEELHMHQCYGLARSNVLVVVGGRHPGYRYDSSEALFAAESSLAASWTAGASLAATASGQHPGLCGLGSGAAMCQLAWAGEAFSLGEDGTPVPLPTTVLERLESKKIDWIVSRRARDLGLLTRDGVLDIAQLAHAMHLRDKLRASCIMEVLHADSAVTARLYDSVVLHQTGKAGTETGRLVGELRQSELVAGPLISLVEGLRTLPGSRGLALGMSRYLMHVPTLKGQLTSLSIFRPRLSLTRHLLHVGLDVADIWAHEKGRALAVEGRVTPGVLSTHNSLEALLPLLQAQDHDPAFRDLVLKMVPQDAGQAELPTVVAGNRAAQKPGHPIIVFLANNPIAGAVVNAAANLARAGRDSIQLVNIVATDMQKSAAEDMLALHKRSAMRSMAEVRTHVVVRRSAGLLECIERVVADIGTEHDARPLVVMGSIQLTSSVFSYMASSVTLSAVKRLAGTPVVVVTLNSKQIPQRPGMRVMALVEPHAKNMVNYLCKHVMEHGRGDRLVLSQVAPSPHVTRQQAAATRRLLDNFHTLAFSLQTPIHKAVAGEGPLESILCEQVEEHGIGMVALQLPPGTKSIPQHLLNMMRSSRGATLIYQENGMRQSVMRKSMTLQRSIGLMRPLEQARRALALGEAMTAGGL